MEAKKLNFVKMTVWIIFLIIDFFNHYLPDFWCLNRLSLLRKNYSFVKMKNNMVSSCDHLLSKMQYFNEWWDVFQIIHKELLYVFISTLCMLSNLCKGYLLTGGGGYEFERVIWGWCIFIWKDCGILYFQLGPWLKFIWNPEIHQNAM